jgi:hypothetical protein
LAVGDRGCVTVGDILEAVDDRARRLQALVPDAPVGRARCAALGDLVLGGEFTLFDHILGCEAPAEARIDDPADTDSPTGSAPRRRRRREVVVTVDLLTLLGLHENPAELAGFGPIPARVARLLLEDASLRRVVTDPITGQALDAGQVYRPTDTLVTAIRVHDQHCQFPGCRRALSIELDHRTEHSRGGTTNTGNLQVLCRRHHALKTAGTWTPTPRPDGSVTWTGPHGQIAVRRPNRE